MPEPKVRFKRDDGSSYPAWIMQSVGDMTVELTDYKPLSCGLPLLTSARTGLMFQDEYRTKSSTENDDTLFSVVPRGAATYRHMSDDDIFHFNINDLVDAGLVSKEYPVFNTVSGNNMRLLIEYLNSSKRFLAFCKAQKKGGTRTRLYFKVLKDFKMPFPFTEEQQKIAVFLSSVDEVIAASEQEVANLETQKKAVMKKIFSQEVRFKRNDGSGFPEWEEAALNDISERIIVGLATTVTPYYRENGVPMFRNLNIRAGYLDDSNILYLDEEYASKQGGKYIHAGDILTVHTGNIGWSCVVPDCYEGALSFTTLITTLKSNVVTNDYVCAYLNSDLGMKQMQDLAFSGGRANLNTSEFQKVIVPIPSLDEQRVIADFLSDFDEAIAAAKKELELWKELKKGLLQQMFV